MNMKNLFFLVATCFLLLSSQGANARFSQADTWGGQQTPPITLNKYAYAHDNPLTYTDSSGHSPLMAQMQVIGIQALSAIRTTGTSINTIRRFNAKLCAIGKQFALPYRQLRRVTAGTPFQAHHVIQDARAAQSVLNYKRLSAIAIPLLGGTSIPGSPHHSTWLLQVKEPLPSPATINQMKAQAYRTLRAAGCRNADATEIVDFAADAIELMRMGVY